MAIPLLARLIVGSTLRRDKQPDTPSVNTNLGMGIEFDTKGLEKRLAKIGQELPKRIDHALHEAALDGVDIILKRTKRGVGAKANFAPYSNSYAKAKFEGWPASEGRRSFSGDTSGVVNLMVTGRMLGALDTAKHRSYSEIFFNRAEESKKAYRNNKTREFMAFNNSSKKKLYERFTKELFR